MQRNTASKYNLIACGVARIRHCVYSERISLMIHKYVIIVYTYLSETVE